MIGEPLLRLDETDSTNRVALDWIDAPHGACVVARSQSAGRGRLGRSWESAAGRGLYFSLVLRETPSAPLYSLLSALGAARALEALCGLRCRVKWPNDILVLGSQGEARKIGGILGEARGDRLVIGIGINLNQSADELPERPIFPAASLRLESGRTWEAEPVLAVVLAELDSLFERLERDGWEALRADFERACLGIGEVVGVQNEGKSRVGVFAGIGDDGALSLCTADGLERVVAGDVSYF